MENVSYPAGVFYVWIRGFMYWFDILVCPGVIWIGFHVVFLFHKIVLDLLLGFR